MFHLDENDFLEMFVQYDNDNQHIHHNHDVYLNKDHNFLIKKKNILTKNLEKKIHLPKVVSYFFIELYNLEVSFKSGFPSISIFLLKAI